MCGNSRANVAADVPLVRNRKAGKPGGNGGRDLRAMKSAVGDLGKGKEPFGEAGK